MQTKNGFYMFYEDFEPLCNWRRNDEAETLVVHLPAFKKDQLKIQVNTAMNTLKISGERLVDATKRSRFYKEIAIPNDCKSKEIHAKFAGGLLHIVMPKKGPQQELSTTTTNQIQQPSTPQNISQDQVTKLPTIILPEQENATGKIGPLNNEMLPGNYIAPDYNDDTEMCDSLISKSLLERATNVAAMVAMAACLGAYIMYFYRSLYSED